MKKDSLHTSKAEDAESLIRLSFEKAIDLKVFCVPDVILGFDTDVCDDLSDIQDFVDALSNFLSMSPEELRAMSEQYLYLEYLEYMNYNHPVDEIKLSAKQVWNEVSFQDLNVVKQSRGFEGAYVQLVIECEWCHRMMQLIYRNGEKLTFVSEENGHYSYSDADGVAESEDRISDYH